MKFLKTNVWIALAVSFLTLFSTGCTEEGDTIVQGDTVKAYFVLYVDYDDDLPGKLSISFATDDMSVIPEVRVNNQKLTNFNIDSDGAIYFYGEVDSTKTVNFTVTANGDTTTGQVTVPNTPSILSVNDIAINDGGYVVLDEASKYTVKWDNAGASEYKLYGYDYSDYNSFELYTSATSYDADFRYGYISVMGINGFNFETGTGPNVTGDYGDGYVMAVSYGENSHVYLYESENADKKSAVVVNETENSQIFNDLMKKISK